jgi:hypothetical protein
MIAALREGHNVVGVDYSRTMHHAQNIRLSQFITCEHQRLKLANRVVGSSGEELYTVATSKQEEAKQLAVKHQQKRHQLIQFFEDYQKAEAGEWSANEVKVIKLFIGYAIKDEQVEALFQQNKRELKSFLMSIKANDAWFAFLDSVKDTDSPIEEKVSILHWDEGGQTRIHLPVSKPVDGSLDTVKSIHGPHLDALLDVAAFPELVLPDMWPPTQ